MRLAVAAAVLLSGSQPVVAGIISHVPCDVAYTGAYMSTLNGACSATQCSDACQSKIDDFFRACAGTKYNETDPITGLVAERSFASKSGQALRVMGPADCNWYRVGSENCDSMCTMGNITGDVSQTTKFEQHRCIGVDPVSLQSGPMAAWHSCESVCRAEFEGLVHSCSGCTDPVLAQFLADAGSKLMMCTVGSHGQSGCAAMADGLDSACCAGLDGIVGNGDDTCSVRLGQMPLVCSDNPVCAAAVKTAATRWCPHQFTGNRGLLGLFLDCGGNLQQLLAAEPVHTKAAIYCDATHNHGIAMPGSYDGGGGGRRALQGVTEGIEANPLAPEASLECQASYQAAFDAAVSGDCAALHCTASCQFKLSQLFSDCQGVYLSSHDTATNLTIRTPFTAKAAAALQLLGPVDCVYSHRDLVR